MQKINLIFEETTNFSIKVSNQNYEHNFQSQEPANSYEFIWYVNLNTFKINLQDQSGLPLNFTQTTQTTYTTTSFYAFSDQPFMLSNIKGTKFEIYANDPKIQVKTYEITYNGIGTAVGEVEQQQFIISRCDPMPYNNIKTLTFSNVEISEIFDLRIVQQSINVKLNPAHSVPIFNTHTLFLTPAKRSQIFTFLPNNVSSKIDNFENLVPSNQLFSLNQLNLLHQKLLQKHQIALEIANSRAAAIANSAISAQKFTSKMTQELENLPNSDLSRVIIELFGALRYGKPGDLAKNRAFLREQETLIQTLERVISTLSV
ncbi:hypothetical protein SS50377_24496 [Spironucleus salmonicida]|uniref:Uncharacterized protein n=1 Tax=Spironucleus salmonicida TaxID=348837 RepID=V6LMV3_9EUKA|nr:hypothetical protein SS50377_24496 [Spironucleus salmonicida]|eukprot:EST45960.1 Hypothetical protein SS50377_13939 [Spironucleus salmonicida]